MEEFHGAGQTEHWLSTRHSGGGTRRRADSAPRLWSFQCSFRPSGRQREDHHDAIAGVIERYRAEIGFAPLDDESRQRTLDLLDAVFLDILQAALNEPTAREVRRESRIQH